MQYLLTVVQLIGSLSAAAAAYAGFKARDDRRTAMVSEMRAEIRMMQKQLEEIRHAQERYMEKIWERERVSA